MHWIEFTTHQWYSASSSYHSDLSASQFLRQRILCTFVVPQLPCPELNCATTVHLCSATAPSPRIELCHYCAFVKCRSSLAPNWIVPLLCICEVPQLSRPELNCATTVHLCSAAAPSPQIELCHHYAFVKCRSSLAPNWIVPLLCTCVVSQLPRPELNCASTVHLCSAAAPSPRIELCHYCAFVKCRSSLAPNWIVPLLCICEVPQLSRPELNCATTVHLWSAAALSPRIELCHYCAFVKCRSSLAPNWIVPLLCICEVPQLSRPELNCATTVHLCSATAPSPRIELCHYCAFVKCRSSLAPNWIVPLLCICEVPQLSRPELNCATTVHLCSATAPSPRNELCHCILSDVTRAAEHKGCNWGMQVDWWLQPYYYYFSNYMQRCSCKCKSILSNGTIPSHAMEWSLFPWHYARWCHWKCGYTQLKAATINHLHAPVRALMFDCSGTQI